MAPTGNTNAVKSGLHSERQIRPVAARHRRNVLRQLRLRAGDLDPIGRAHLNNYARLQAKLDAADAYIGEHGMLRADGEPQPVMRLYVSLANSSRLALQRLDEHLRATHKAPGQALNAYLDEHYGGAGLDADES